MGQVEHAAGEVFVDRAHGGIFQAFKHRAAAGLGALDVAAAGNVGDDVRADLRRRFADDLLFALPNWAKIFTRMR